MKKSLFLFASIFALYSCQNKEEKLIIEHLQQDRIYDFEIMLNSSYKCNGIHINNLFKFFVWCEVSKSFTRSII